MALLFDLHGFQSVLLSLDVLSLLALESFDSFDSLPSEPGSSRLAEV